MTNQPQLPANPVFAALDTTDLDQARAWAEALRGHVGGVKTGLEFFAANGADGVRAIVDLGLPDLSFGFLYLPAAAGLAVGALVGSPFGIRASHRIPDILLHRMFIGHLAFILTVMLIWGR